MPKFFFSSDRMKVGKNVIFSDAKIRVAEYLVFTLISRHRLLLLFSRRICIVPSSEILNLFQTFLKENIILICARKCRFSLMKVWKMMLLLYKFYRGLKSKKRRGPKSSYGESPLVRDWLKIVFT